MWILLVGLFILVVLIGSTKTTETPTFEKSLFVTSFMMTSRGNFDFVSTYNNEIMYEGTVKVTRSSNLGKNIVDINAVNITNEHKNLVMRAFNKWYST